MKNTIRTILIYAMGLAVAGLMYDPNICAGYSICRFSPFPLIWVLMAIFIGLVFWDYKKVWREGMYRLKYPNDKNVNSKKFESEKSNSN